MSPASAPPGKPVGRPRTIDGAALVAPAEWEPQAGVWLSWPHNRKSWPGQFRPVPYAFARFVKEISLFEPVHINCAAPLQPRARRLCQRAGADMPRVHFYDHPTNDAWCRDHGPIFLKNRETGEVVASDWRYNAWGGKYPHDLDNQIPALVAEKLGLRRIVYDQVLEGGSIDVNGQGLLLTTEQCLLHPNRNPQLSRAEIEHSLKNALGVSQILWLGDGILGDDTDGHIDDITRFYKADGIITCIEPNRSDGNQPILEENLRRLRAFRTPQGRPFDIVTLPMPEPISFQGQRVPASYANFLIINGAVLVPQFRQPHLDQAACTTLSHCFPDREIIGIDCYDLIWGLGTLHCLSQQMPA
ncbi:agmatine deiminase family protein [Cephaloticoccus primus]|uniref:agmatine deiminase family protein n=1 Tax=Cephaloticoccus primus TaxID=1548207 RepID=UPI001E47A3B0|nr:agmatine deiminase family protein [Cephaloticoccus primus]